MVNPQKIRLFAEKMRKKDILHEILAHKRFEVDRMKLNIPQMQLEDAIERAPKVPSMRESLEKSSSGIIAEFKRRSPSKGWIHKDARPVDIIPGYDQAGAAALSILTDEAFFGGTLSDIKAIASQVSTPILRKEFIVDEYQLYQARIIGASAVLLIAAALTPERCKALVKKAHEIELEVLLEIHSEDELEYITPEVDMVGVNNRNLGTFHTDVQNSFRIAELLPKDTLLVSESGISSAETIRELRKVGYRGFLMGEAFMKTEDPARTLKELIEKIEQ